MTHEAIDPKGSEMALILTIDTMAKRYSLLPSQIMQSASTFDLVILDAALSWEHYERQRSDPKNVPEVPVDELIKIRDRNQ